MGKKYIVEIGRLERLYKASVNGNGKPNITWLAPEVDLTPYAEPDLEQVRKEAYEQGQEDLRKSCVPQDEEAYGIGYNEGFQCGLDLAWEAARKIELGTNDGGLSADTMTEIFGTLIPNKVLRDFTATEAIEKIRQYEQRQEEQIQVGDEVNAPFGKAIVVNINSVAEKIWLVYADGHGGFEYFKDAPTKTGRHFPEIATVLEKMRGEQDG